MLPWQINSNLGTWIDILTTANIRVPISFGLYESFLRYNPYTKQIIGIIYVTYEATIINQSVILTMPHLDGIGINPFIGVCGISSYHKDEMIVSARVKGNDIYSTHSAGRTTTSEFAYMINFIVASN